MAEYILSKDADDDLLAIANFTVLNFGEDQAIRYLNELKQLLGQLCQKPELGRGVPEYSPIMKRFNFRSHVIFYQPVDVGILIVRVLHKSMDFEQHL
jgi:toxin ParE1/3/4